MGAKSQFQINQVPKIQGSISNSFENYTGFYIKQEEHDLNEKMQKEMDEYKKNGMADMYAMAMVSEKYKADIVKHREALMPLMQLMMKK